MAIVVGDILALSIVELVDGVSAVTVHHVRVDDLGATTNDDQLVDDLINDNIVSNYLAGRWANANAVGVQARCALVQKVAPAREVRFLRTFAVQGVLLVDHSPSNSAVMIKTRSFNTGRGGSGRNFFAAPAETLTLKGRLTVQGMTLWGLVAAYWSDTIDAGTASFTPVVFHPSTLGHDVATRSFADPIIRKHRNRNTTICPV